MAAVVERLKLLALAYCFLFVLSNACIRSASNFTTVFLQVALHDDGFCASCVILYECTDFAFILSLYFLYRGTDFI